MARWLSFSAEYNFRVEYKPGRLNVVADALPRRPDYAVEAADANRVDVARTYTSSSSLLDEVKASYAHDADAKQPIEFLSAPSNKACRNAVDNNVERIVVPNDPGLRSMIMYEYHDIPTTGHPGREKTYSLLTRDFYWNHQYKWVPKYCWESVSMDFVFGLPRDSRRKTGIVVFVDRFSKMVHLAAVAADVTSVQTARLFVDMVFKHHGMPNDYVSDRDPRFTARFWQEVFTLLGTQFSMSTADHPQTDGQTKRVNRVLVDLLKSYAQSFHNWSDYLPMSEFGINNAVHASTGHTPFYINAMRHPRLPSTLGTVPSSLSRGRSTVARKQPQNSADTNLSAAMTRARARARTRQGEVSVSGTATVKNHEQAIPATTKDNVSVRGTYTKKTHTQAGPVVRISDVSMPDIDTDRNHAQAGPAAITHNVSVPGTDTTKDHAQSGTEATPSDESVQGTDADKVNELDQGFSSQAMDFVHERQAVR
ncbi:Retroelement [Phytophthora megakarya]|uniref:Retroelement n=1 Tax=Phytophthora megakarya TaxID=4795 RepID=A0A225VBV4_9STRA|nr:Retroelement [Phytophthora megakarya]